MKLDKAYKLFQERSEDSFWTNRALKTADHMLLVTSATVAKKARAMIQDVGLREAKAGLERYPSEMLDMESLEVIDDSDENGSEAEEEVGSPATGMYSVSLLSLHYNSLILALILNGGGLEFVL